MRRLLLFCFLAFCFSGCDVEAPEFSKGQLIKAKLDGRIGMVVAPVYMGGFSVDHYKIRFSTAVGKGSPEKETGASATNFYQLEDMKPFEIEAIGSTKE